MSAEQLNQIIGYLQALNQKMDRIDANQQIDRQTVGSILNIVTSLNSSQSTGIQSLTSQLNTLSVSKTKTAKTTSTGEKKAPTINNAFKQLFVNNRAEAIKLFKIEQDMIDRISNSETVKSETDPEKRNKKLAGEIWSLYYSKDSEKNKEAKKAYETYAKEHNLAVKSATDGVTHPVLTGTSTTPMPSINLSLPSFTGTNPVAPPSLNMVTLPQFE
jgi:hypothetical protein